MTGKSQPRVQIEEFEYQPIGDDELPGCRALMRAILLRSIHDACGSVVFCNAESHLDIARRAWSFLHAGYGQLKQDRHFLAELSGFEPGAFDRQILKAQIPEPTKASLKNSSDILELAYWRMNDCQGPQPIPRKKWNGYTDGKRPTTRAGRQAATHSRVLKCRMDARTTGYTDTSRATSKELVW